MVQGLDVGEFIVEYGQMLFKVLLSELFLAVNLMLNLLPAIVE